MHEFVVLQSFQKPRPTTNPYVVQLADRLRELPGVTVKNWTWRTALFGRYDVLHVHWPEILVDGHSPLKRCVRQALFAAVLLRLRWSRTPLVRTVHNLDLPSGLSLREVLLLRWAERWTNYRIVINATTPIAPGTPHTVIPHGHYRDWFAAQVKPQRVPGRISYFGLIRRYKSVDQLLTAYLSAGDGLRDTTLHVAGNPSSEGLAEHLEQLAAGDPRVTLTFKFLTDEELVSEVSGSSLVVLPYREMHNSGATLTALSLDRPVLVPDNPSNRALADEVGTAWVYTYAGQLEPDDLVVARDQAARLNPTARPDLSQRDWDRAGELHLAAYRESVRLNKEMARPVSDLADIGGPGAV